VNTPWSSDFKVSLQGCNIGMDSMLICEN